MLPDSTEMDDGASVEAFAHSLKTASDIEGVEVASKPTAVKPKPRTRKASEPTVSGDEMKPIFSTIGNLAAARWPGVRPLDDEEVDKLSSAWAPVIEKYAPSMAERSVELGAILATLAVAAPRVLAYRASQQLSSDGQLELLKGEE